jgi:arylsulfatase A-like enzyme
VLSALAALVACREAMPPAPRPNILLYVVDTLRADGLGIYGNQRASTPHFDAFAREGVVFEDAWANSSWTRASMSSLLTGLLPWHHRAERRDDRLPEEVATLATHLGKQGYSCGMVTANPNVGSVFGFQRASGSLIELYKRRKFGKVKGGELNAPSNVVTRKAIAWLDRATPPFCLVVLAIDPHSPYKPPARFDPGTLRDRSEADGDFKWLLFRKTSADDRARIRELYQAEIAFNDESFGHLIDALRKRGLLRNTVAVVTADHGEEFWEQGRRGHGKSLSEQVLRVPLMIRYPRDSRLRAGSRITRPVQLVDVLPTLLDLAGAPALEGIDGGSLLRPTEDDPAPILSGLSLDGRELLAARQYPWKLVWDREEDSFALYDLRIPAPEVAPVSPASGPEAGAAARRLRLALEASIATDTHGDTPSRSTVTELPADVEESLRALGYTD